MKANTLSADEMKSQSVDILEIDIEQFRINNFVKLLGDDLNDNLQQLKALQPADLLEVKTANGWIEQASKRPIPRMLFSEFWYEQELCILFADTNVGKTILAVQIADSISRGKSIPGFKLETNAQKVIYCDFELNDKQFQGRYSCNYEDPYQFSDNFLRVEINPEADFPEDASFEFALSNAIEKVITETGAKIVIIDNIIVCQITKPDNFLHFEYLHLDSEYKHLKTVTERDREILVEEVSKCMKEDPSISAYAIAKRLCPDDKKFSSFKIKILRIYKKIIQDNNHDDDVDSRQLNLFKTDIYNRLRDY